jgi:hypothetical protein
MFRFPLDISPGNDILSQIMGPVQTPQDQEGRFILIVVLLGIVVAIVKSRRPA